MPATTWRLKLLVLGSLGRVPVRRGAPGADVGQSGVWKDKIVTSEGPAGSWEGEQDQPLRRPRYISLFHRCTCDGDS